MTVRMFIHKDEPLTDDQISEVENATLYPITFDDDCPELTDDQINKYLSKTLVNNKADINDHVFGQNSPVFA